MIFPLPRKAGLLLLAALCPTALAQLPESIRPGVLEIARSATPAPGTTGDFVTFLEAVSNDAGDVAFRAELTGARTGVWLAPAGQPAEMIALSGDSVPGLATATFSQFNELNLNDAGDLAFLASFFGAPSSENEALFFRPAGGSLSLAVREGQSLGGDAGEDPVFLARPRLVPVSGERGFVMNNSGRLGFQTDLLNALGGAVGTASITHLNGSTEAVATSNGGGVQVVGPNPTLNASGVFAGYVTGSDPNRVFPNGVSQDSIAPDTSGALFSGAFDPPVINALGAIAFVATLENPPGTTPPLVSSGNRSGIFATVDGPALIARGGDPAPGTAGVFDEFFSASLILNDLGDIVFEVSAKEGTASRKGLWRASPSGALRKVAVAGDPVPGLPGHVFAFGSNTTLSQTAALNARGTLVFLALAEPIAGGPSELCLFAEVAGRLLLVLKSGDAIRLGDGSAAIISRSSVGSIGFAGGTGNGDGRRSALNDADELTLDLAFEPPAGSAVVTLANVRLEFARTAARPGVFPVPGLDAKARFTLVPGIDYAAATTTDLADGFTEAATVSGGAEIDDIELPLPGTAGEDKLFLQLDITAE